MFGNLLRRKEGTVRKSYLPGEHVVPGLLYLMQWADTHPKVRTFTNDQYLLIARAIWGVDGSKEFLELCEMVQMENPPENAESLRTFKNFLDYCREQAGL